VICLHRFVGLFLMALHVGACHAADRLELPLITPAMERVSLRGSTYVLEDAGAATTFQDVSSDPLAGDFRPGKPTIGFTTSAYWLRFSVRAPAGEPMELLFDTGDRTLQEIDVYVSGPRGLVQHHSASSTRPYADRPVPAPGFAFPVVLQPETTTTIYLRVRAYGALAVLLDPALWQPEAFFRELEEDKHAWWLYIGMALSLGLFNFLLFVSLRDWNYLAYVGSLISVVWAACDASGGNGFAFAYFWPNYPRMEQFSWMASIAFSTLMPFIFMSRFLGMRELRPRLYRIALGSGVLLFVLDLFQATLMGFGVTHAAGLLQLVYQISVPPYLIFMISVTWAIVSLAIGGLRNAVFLSIAWIPLLASAIVVSTSIALGWGVDRQWVLWASAFELIMMSLALADRFNQERREKAVAQRALVDGLRKSEIELEGRVSQRTQELSEEKARTQNLLHNILPAAIAHELSITGTTTPVRHEEASVLFTDFNGFTQVASTMPAGRMVAELNEVFAAFDDICDEEGVEKIKTIGDAYMAAAGLPKPCADHAQRCVRAGLRMAAFVEQRNSDSAFKWRLRVGTHSGPVIAGVVGKRKYAFDIWGDTVNIASRMESAGEPGRVNVSAYTYDLIRKEFECEYRGRVDAKGKGEVDMYFVSRAASTMAKAT
jgi:class 3 adenylate cyclase